MVRQIRSTIASCCYSQSFTKFTLKSRRQILIETSCYRQWQRLKSWNRGEWSRVGDRARFGRSWLNAAKLGILVMLSFPPCKRVLSVGRSRSWRHRGMEAYGIQFARKASLRSTVRWGPRGFLTIVPTRKGAKWRIWKLEFSSGGWIERTCVSEIRARSMCPRDHWKRG